jgi:hypothetical protein
MTIQPRPPLVTIQPHPGGRRWRGRSRLRSTTWLMGTQKENPNGPTTRRQPGQMSL